jgi:hypothetical protein
VKYLKSYKIYESKHELEEVILSCFEDQIDNERVFILKNDSSEKLFFINLDLTEIFDKRPENWSIILLKIVPNNSGYDLYVYKQTVGDLSRTYPEEYSNLEQSLDYLGYKITKTDDFPRGVNFMERNILTQEMELSSKFMRFMTYKIEEI